jgi:hypothetical protein
MRFPAALAVTVALLGCSPGPGINNVTELADAMKEEGVVWISSGKLERPRIRPKIAVEEGFWFEGEGLSIEVFRVEEERWFKTAAVALTMRSGFEPEDSENALVDALARHPFLVAVVEEPEPGIVRAAFNRAYPEKESDGE